MKADNSLPVVGQGFKKLCNLPTSFTLSWNSRVKLAAGWTSVVEFEGVGRKSDNCSGLLSHSPMLEDTLYTPAPFGKLVSVLPVARKKHRS